MDIKSMKSTDYISLGRAELGHLINLTKKELMKQEIKNEWTRTITGLDYDLTPDLKILDNLSKKQLNQYYNELFEVNYLVDA